VKINGITFPKIVLEWNW